MLAVFIVIVVVAVLGVALAWSRPAHRVVVRRSRVVERPVRVVERPVTRVVERPVEHVVEEPVVERVVERPYGDGLL